MRLGIYLVRDAKAEAFLSQPLMAQTAGMAERQFMDLVRNPEGFIGKHAGDFSLWCVGTLDDVSGQVFSDSPREVLTGPTVLQLIKEA